jgi:hypothetical protein
MVLSFLARKVTNTKQEKNENPKPTKTYASGAGAASFFSSFFFFFCIFYLPPPHRGIDAISALF